MKTFVVKFKNSPELICRLNDTPLANRYYDLVKQQYLEDPRPIFRDPQKYTIDYFQQLVMKAKETLGWDWCREEYNLTNTIHLHKYVENYLAQGFENIPEEYDEILHELHFALHAIEAGSRRDNWLQIEWFNNRGFPILAEEYNGKIFPEFGDLRLQNPYVGHHPLYLYEQQDTVNVMQTCKFHDYCKPGINIVIYNYTEIIPFSTQFSTIDHYINWFRDNAPEFVEAHGQEKILQFTGHPIVGKILNLDDLKTVVNMPVIEFEYLKF